MDIFAALLQGFATAITPINLLWAFVGCVLGTAVGVLPGIGPAVAVAMLLPITGKVDITANSPLTVGSPGIQAGGDITLVASNLTSAGDMTLEGPISSTAGSIVLDAGRDLTQNSSVFAALGVSASAGGTLRYGPLATSNNSPIVYRQGGTSVDPPPSSLGASTPILQETAKQVDVLVTFLDLFEKAVDEQQGAADEETNADGTRKKKDTEAIVTEGEVCK